MAERESTPRDANVPGTSPPAQPGAHDARQVSAPGQKPGQESHQAGQELTAQGKAVAAEAMTQSREYVRAWQTQLEQQVREQPLQTLLMAAGIGLLLGLLRRR
jgi:ElaB/YqjD/DUF883 family membrane-anchored ribosome-binding protein